MTSITITLNAASWDLNTFGIDIFHQTVEWLGRKRESLSLTKEIENGVEIEKVNDKYGKKREGYVGKYNTTEKRCTYSGYQRNSICIHILFFRETKGLSPNDKTMFPQSFYSGIRNNSDTDCSEQEE